MAQVYTLPLVERDGTAVATIDVVGGKGTSLSRLASAGLPVPDGFHITTAAYRLFVDQNDLHRHIHTALSQVDPAVPSALEAASRAIGSAFAKATIPPEVSEAIAQAYLGLGDAPAVAVRSSATAEDLPDLSFAGQQETFLNVQGLEELAGAVQRCWASLWTARAIGYRARHGIDQDAVSLAIVVQLLVQADRAGVMFTANPLNGSRQEVVINAAWGLGEAVVGGQVSPDTIVADKAIGTVVRIEVADKAVMTVPTRRGTAEEPVAQSRRRARVLDDAQVAELVRLGRQVEELYGVPQDIEWCYAQGQFYILQSRSITTLSQVAPSVEALPGELQVQVPPPSEWKGPNRRARYMRNNIVELIPDPMTPLFGTLGRRVINTSMNQLVSAFLGGPSILPGEMIITIHGYAYYNGAFTAKQIAQILVGSVGIMRRMLTGAAQRWRDARLRYKTVVEDHRAAAWRASSSAEILHRVPEILGAAIEYYGALVSGVVPGAWISEGLFTAAYGRLIQRKGDPSAPTYLLGFDSTPILAEKALYDLAQWARDRAGLAQYLTETPAVQIATDTVAESPPAQPDGVAEGNWQEWRERFCTYLQQYGATVYDLDFAKPTPADDPTPVLEAFKLFLRGEGTDPYARQRAAAQRRQEAMQATLARLRGLRLKIFRRLVDWAQAYARQREDGLADIGLGYPLIREMLLEAGSRLAEAGTIDEAGDVFWLLEDEVERAAAALDRGEPLASMAPTVRQRKAVWQARKQVSPPVSLPLPPKFLMRLMPSQFGGLSASDVAAPSTVIRGTPCSPGVATATARVMHGPEDFDSMKPGDVLVAAITTPAWTPLFAMASAIVTDVGGPLSHGSIVAREYGIPAVLGTGSATRRIKSGDRVRVDGERGTVEVLDS